MDTPPPWLTSAKHHLLHHSPSVSLLRSRASDELRSRLQTRGLLKPGGLDSLDPVERESVIREVVESLTKHHAESGEPNTETESLWKKVRNEIERTVDEKLGVAVLAGVLGDPRVANGGADVDAKVRIALMETQKAAIHLLTSHPTSTTALRGCINIELPKDLRRVAWKGVLKDSRANRDFGVYLHSERFDRMVRLGKGVVYEICQTYLISFPTLLPLATHYRCVKRMEQSLLHILDPDSCPHLRDLNLGIPCLLDEEDVALETIVVCLRADTKPNNNNNSNNDGAGAVVDPRTRVKTADWKRLMAFMVPILKVVEVDAPWKGRSILSEVVVDDSGRGVEEESALLPGMIASAAEGASVGGFQKPNVSKGKAGKQNVGVGAGGVTVLQETEESKTAKVSEMFARFWSLLPEDWRMAKESMYHKITLDVETYIQQEDFELFSHLLDVLNAGKQEGGFQGFLDMVKIIVGDIFVGKVNLDTLCYIYDQFIIASYEATDDPDFPNLDTLLSWFCSAILIVLRTKLLKCSVEKYLHEILLLHLASVTPSTLSAAVEVRFINRFRRTLKNPTDLHSQLFGYEKPFVSDNEGGPHLEKAKAYRKRVGKGYRWDIDEVESEEEKELVSLCEEDIIAAEEEGEERIMQWMEERKRRAERRARNMKEQRLEELRNRMNQPDESQSHEPVIEPMPTDRLPSPGLDMHSDSHSDNSDNDSAMMHLLESEIQQADMPPTPIKSDSPVDLEPEKLARPPRRLITSIFVKHNTPAGDEIPNLNPLGSIFRTLLMKLSYILLGSPMYTLEGYQNWTHAFAFQYQLDKDVETVTKGSVKSWAELTEAVKSGKAPWGVKKGMEKAFSGLDKARNKRRVGVRKKVGEGMEWVADEGDEAMRELGRATTMRLSKNPTERAQLKSMTGLIALTTQKISELIFHSNPLIEASYVSLSLAAEEEFEVDSKSAWLKTFPKSKPYTASNVKLLVRPDQTVAGSDKVAVKEEMERRKMRELYFKNLDKIRDSRFRKEVVRKK
ncbi:hypothetical protein HDV05_002588 [Chytridiales sp. JEL 0842]|nr:hypothetical protein HDV05_002588 [Chytridiales sp. JEL 0842]